MERFTIYCTPKQTMKAHELGAPIEILPNYTEYRVFPLIKFKDGNERPCVLPTAEQMIGWLEEQEVMIDITHQTDGYCLISVSSNAKQIKTKIEGSIYKKGATLAAIDAALEYLEEKHKTN